MTEVRGAALVDLNRDGLLDLVQVARRANVKLWRNAGSGDRQTTRPMGRWIAVDLQQEGPNRDAIGSWITVRTGPTQLEREVTVGGGHASGQLVPIHFGLGAAERADVRVTWPDGEVGPWMPVDADRVVTHRSRRDGRPAGEPVGDSGPMTTARHARLAEVALPDFGRPSTTPEVPASVYGQRMERLRERMARARLRPHRRVRGPRAQREPRRT